MLAAIDLPIWVVPAIAEALLVVSILVSDHRGRRRRRRDRQRARARRGVAS